MVVVKKKNGKYKVYIDFTDLNKECPKDPFSLPHIDSLVDATACHEMFTFMDGSIGFQEFQLEPSDQEDTTFITPKCIYRYIPMIFGLKNTSVINQRVVNKMFEDQLGKIMEVYIDDVVIKSKKSENHL